MRREEGVRCGMTDVFEDACGVCIVSRWVAGGVYIGVIAGARGPMYGLKKNR